MAERVVFYTSKMITEQMGKGDDYNLKKVISIIITDYRFITENQVYHNKYQLYDIKTGSKFTDIIEINTLELPKIPKETDETSLWDWLKFLNCKKEEEFSMIAEKSPQIYKAVAILKELSHDERTRLLYEEREKAIRDERSRIVYAFEKGVKQGIKQGVNKKVYEIVKNFLEDGLPIEKVMQYTKLTKEQIETLQKEMQQ